MSDIRRSRRQTTKPPIAKRKAVAPLLPPQEITMEKEVRDDGPRDGWSCSYHAHVRSEKGSSPGGGEKPPASATTLPPPSPPKNAVSREHLGTTAGCETEHEGEQDMVLPEVANPKNPTQKEKVTSQEGVAGTSVAEVTGLPIASTSRAGSARKSKFSIFDWMDEMEEESDQMDASHVLFTTQEEPPRPCPSDKARPSSASTPAVFGGGAERNKENMPVRRPAAPSDGNKRVEDTTPSPPFARPYRHQSEGHLPRLTPGVHRPQRPQPRFIRPPNPTCICRKASAAAVPPGRTFSGAYGGGPKHNNRGGSAADVTRRSGDVEFHRGAGGLSGAARKARNRGGSAADVTRRSGDVLVHRGAGACRGGTQEQEPTLMACRCHPSVG